MSDFFKLILIEHPFFFFKAFEIPCDVKVDAVVIYAGILLNLIKCGDS